VAVDTACSSALVALHSSLESLAAGSCRAAAACGVSVMLMPDTSAMFQKAGAHQPCFLHLWFCVALTPSIQPSSFSTYHRSVEGYTILRTYFPCCMYLLPCSVVFVLVLHKSFASTHCSVGFIHQLDARSAAALPHQCIVDAMHMHVAIKQGSLMIHLVITNVTCTA
jgi:hypothetical protein